MYERLIRSGMLLGEDAAERLEQSHVAVFGLGGVGSWCAEALARSGVGALTLVDEDTVSESNINRQACASYKTLGMSKAEATAQRLKDINPELRLKPVTARYGAESREAFFGDRPDWDYIVDAIDLVSCKTDLIETAKKLRIPIISALGAGNKLDASRLEICDISQTRSCPLARVMRRELRARGIEGHTVVFSPEEKLRPLPSGEAPPPGRRSVPGSVVWVTATAGMLLAQHVVLELSKK